MGTLRSKKAGRKDQTTHVIPNHGKDQIAEPT